MFVLCPKRHHDDVALRDLAISFQCSLIAQTVGAAAVGGASNC